MGWVEDDWSASTQHQPLLSVRTEYDDDRRQSCGTPHRSSLATLHEDEAFSPPVDGNTSPVHKWPSQSSIFAAQEGAPELTFIIRTQSRVGAVGAENADQVITDVNVTEAVQDVVQDVLQGAVQQALGEQLRFDVKANIYTLFAVTGVILFWRGVWTLWDKLCGNSLLSQVGSLMVGLSIVLACRIFNLPLLQGLPGG